MKAAEMSQQNRNAAREQIAINTRLTSLQAVQDIYKNAGMLIDAAKLVDEAKIVEAYILDGIETAKKESAIVVTGAMPPKGLFKPGQ